MLHLIYLVDLLILHSSHPRLKINTHIKIKYLVKYTNNLNGNLFHNEIDDARISKYLDQTNNLDSNSLSEKNRDAIILASLIDELKKNGKFKKRITLYLSDDGIYDIS